MSAAQKKKTVDTLIVGTGLSGLAMAAELHRNNMPATIISGPNTSGSPATTSSLPVIDSTQIEGWNARLDIVKHLENYTRTNDMDVRKSTHVESIAEVPAVSGGDTRWIVTTDNGTIYAHNIVLAGKSGSIPQYSHYETVNDKDVPDGIFVVGRTIGFGKAAIKEILAQIRRVVTTLKSQNSGSAAHLR